MKKRKTITTFLNNTNGTLTVEASITIPMFLISIIMMIHLIKSILEKALIAFIIIDNLVFCAMSDINGSNNDYIKAVYTPMNKIQSECKEKNKVFLDYTVREIKIHDYDFIEVSTLLDFKIFGMLYNNQKLEFFDSIYLAPFCGYKNKNYDFVYITRYGKVYHLDSQCSHLKLQIKRISMDQLEIERNLSGGKYHICELCKDYQKKDNFVYISNWGDAWHKNMSCSGLRRYIIPISKEAVSNRVLCEKCKKNSSN